MSDATHYTPRTGSLAAQMVRFFTNNPGEELALEDIVGKFDAVRGNIHTLLRPAIDAGYLVRTRNEDGDYLYRRGQRIGSRAAAVPSLAAQLAKKRVGRPDSAASLAYTLDFDKLQVESDIPFVKTAKKGENKWTPLFEKLTTPGQSVEVPKHLNGALKAAASKYNTLQRGTYRVALNGPSMVRVWRIA